MTEPKVYTVHEWGGKIIPHPTLKRSQAVGIVLHHTAGPNRKAFPADLSFERDKGFQLAREIQAAHLQRGWVDSGHHFLVTRGGLIMEGRNGSYEAAREGHVIQGAHAGNNVANRTRWGIEHEGTYTTETMPKEQWAASIALSRWLCAMGGVVVANIGGHRVWKATQCPGDHFFSQIPDYRKMAGAQ